MIILLHTVYYALSTLVTIDWWIHNHADVNSAEGYSRNRVDTHVRARTGRTPMMQRTTLKKERALRANGDAIKPLERQEISHTNSKYCGPQNVGAALIRVKQFQWPA